MQRILIFVFLLIAQSAIAQDDANRYRISLLTCAPGTEVYSIFGHSAIRVQDRKTRRERIYNFGIFDFDTPNFTLKFIRGNLKYKLGTQQFKRFLREYEYYKRGVVENFFDLSDGEKEEMVRLLEENYRPENRYYQYDFFFDNCSSRIRDLLEKVTGQVLTGNAIDEDITFRQMVDLYTTENSWLEFGIDLILGRPADAVAGFRGQMFLPDYLKANLMSATHEKTGNSITEADKPIYVFPEVPPQSSFFTSPLFWNWILFILVGILSFFKPNTRFMRIFDAVLITISGIAGALFLFMWVGTDHDACFANWNMLWLFPLNLFLGWTLARKRQSNGLRYYFLFVAALIAIAILGWWFIPQFFHPAALPLMLLILLRLVFRNLTFDTKMV